MATLKFQLERAADEITSLKRQLRECRERQDASREAFRKSEDALKEFCDKDAVAARLKAAEMEVVRLEEFEGLCDEAEAAMKERTGNDYGDITEVGDLADDYMRQKAKIAELENLLAVDGLRLTQAWRQISELKRTAHAAQP